MCIRERQLAEHPLIVWCTSPSPQSVQRGTHYLIERNLIRPEELLGIENLIVGGGKILKERQTHSRLILKTQSELENKKDVNIGQKLADVAAAKSLKNVNKARLRAVLAA